MGGHVEIRSKFAEAFHLRLEREIAGTKVKQQLHDSELMRTYTGVKCRPFYLSVRDA